MVAENDAEHRTHEGKECDVKPAGFGMSLQILRRVDHDQSANAGDQRGEHKTQPIEMKRERQLQTWHPGDDCREWTIGAD